MRITRRLSQSQFPQALHAPLRISARRTRRRRGPRRCRVLPGVPASRWGVRAALGGCLNWDTAPGCSLLRQTAESWGTAVAQPVPRSHPGRPHRTGLCRNNKPAARPCSARTWPPIARAGRRSTVCQSSFSNGHRLFLQQQEQGCSLPPCPRARSGRGHELK